MTDAMKPGSTGPDSEAMPVPGSRRVAHPLRARLLQIDRIEALGPRMVRVVLTGPDLAGFREEAPRDHVKLFLPGPDGTVRLPTIADDRWVDRNTATGLIHRDYTVRRYDPERGELWIDVALHGGGVIGPWIESARPGDPVGVLGPRASAIIADTVDGYLFATDETALPALARWLERLRPGVPVTVFVEVVDDQDRQQLSTEAAAEVTWLYRNPAEPPCTALVRAVNDAHLPADGLVWVAGETGAMSRLRRDLIARATATRTRVIVEGYWRLGVADYDHHIPLEDVPPKDTPTAPA